MIDYRPLNEVIRHDGLRLVLVKGMPSPWSQAAKTIFEIKGLRFMAGGQILGEKNEELVAWCGERNAPVVAWANERPITRWLDILYLAERLAPAPALVPSDPLHRALMIGFSNELLGEFGIVWNRRLQGFGPAMESGGAPEHIARMAKEYRYNQADAALAGARIASSLTALATQLHVQYERGAQYFIGDALSALDIYFVTAMNTVVPLPPEQCPIPEAWRPAFVATDPKVVAALDPLLLRHRNKIFGECFRDPMEL